ncbi:DUF3054 domain-containing protein [Cellulomonas aerilata]|uniref:DUF3054 domain-containing protein n=1 Tax=Cellulomonas aerilata TaxID=515326 RepID=UPI0011BE5C6E|nr:DUF3054 domain-containing protein [Cellulomonas aerilata]
MPATPLPLRTPATSPGDPSRAAATAVAVAVAVALDVAVVVGFAAAGRSSHAESGDVAGVLGTAWPFLAAAAAGWLVTRAWRAPTRVRPTGVVVWAAAWGLGLALRGLSGDGLAAPFVAVSAVVLAAGLVGWRAVATALSAVRRRRARRPTSVPAPRR